MQNISFQYLYVGHINYWLGANTITTMCLFLACICSIWLVGTIRLNENLITFFLHHSFQHWLHNSSKQHSSHNLPFWAQKLKSLRTWLEVPLESPRYPQQIARVAHWSTGYGIQHNWLLSSRGAAHSERGGSRARPSQGSSDLNAASCDAFISWSQHWLRDIFGSHATKALKSLFFFLHILEAQLICFIVYAFFLLGDYPIRPLH